MTTNTDAARLRDAMSDVEYMLLEMRLQADAQFIADLTVRGEEAEARAYIRDTDYIARRDAWRAGRR